MGQKGREEEAMEDARSRKESEGRGSNGRRKKKWARKTRKVTKSRSDRKEIGERQGNSGRSCAR